MSAPVQVMTVMMLAVFWAVNWPMMKIGLTTVEPWTFRATIVLVGGVGCLMVARLSGRSIAIHRDEVRPLLWLTLFQGVLWNAFSGFGIALVDAGRAAVLGFTMPVWATLLSILVLKEAVTARRALGLATGMAGMAVLIWPSLETLGGQLTGTLLMIAGAMTWGVATVLLKATEWKMGVLALSGWQFVIASAALIPAAVLLGEPASLLRIDPLTGGALAYSALVPMIFCQAVWFAVVRRLPTTLASMGTLLVPPLGVYFSALILGEQVGVLEVAALLLVVAALVLILPGFDWRSVLHPQPVSRTD